jgi:hypothetical protein
MIENKTMSPEEIDREQFEADLKKLEKQNPDFVKKNKEKLDHVKSYSKKGDWKTAAFSLLALATSYFINVPKAEAGNSFKGDLPKKPEIKRIVKQKTNNRLNDYSEPLPPPSQTKYENPMNEYSEPVPLPKNDVKNKANNSNDYSEPLPPPSQTKYENPMNEYSEPVPLPKK